MIGLTIRFGDKDDSEPTMPEFVGRAIVHLGEGAIITLSFLEAGMQSGKASVGFAFELPDGRVVLAETSLALLETAVNAAIAKYGSQL